MQPRVWGPRCWVLALLALGGAACEEEPQGEVAAEQDAGGDAGEDGGDASDDASDASDDADADAPPSGDEDQDGVGDRADNCPSLANPTQLDGDDDGAGDACDVCPELADPEQADADGDGVGDACEAPDADGDGVSDAEDNCPAVGNEDQRDPDLDGVGSACDNCPDVENADQADADGDGRGDVCLDSDEDGVPDAKDNCPRLANPDQADGDGNQVGDLCQDTDRDAVIDLEDNCPAQANPTQVDGDEDGAGDACDNCPDLDNAAQEDEDEDGAGDACDNCAGLFNADQGDLDGDGAGDACDEDQDGDGLDNGLDGCPRAPDPGQEDGDEDGVGDACDNCAAVANPDQADQDATRQATREEVALAPLPTPSESLALGDDDISEPLALGFEFEFFGRRYDQVRVSSNGFITFDLNASPFGSRSIPDPAEPNALIAGYWEDLNPRDGGTISYGVVGEAPRRAFVVAYEDVPLYGFDEALPTVRFQIVLREGAPEVEVHCERCAGNEFDAGIQGIEDHEGLEALTSPGSGAEGFSVLGGAARFSTRTLPADGAGDACDVCPRVADPAQADGDRDGAGDVCDNCAQDANPAQGDVDGDGVGDLCQDDDRDGVTFDGDGSGDPDDRPCAQGATQGCDDNCPRDANPDQRDDDFDGAGDVCDNCAATANRDQRDDDFDGAGDACDNCLFVNNPEQDDQDRDARGDACDNCPDLDNFGQEDQDGDGVGDVCDNCPILPNPDQTDLDGDGIGEPCEDDDDDNVLNGLDNCPGLANAEQQDEDRDRVGDVCDNCPQDRNPDQREADALVLEAEGVPFALRPAPTQLIALSDDSFSQVIDLGFEFEFFGERKRQLRICSNGFVSFDLDSFSSLGDFQLGSANEPNDAIMAYAVDLNPGQGGTIAYDLQGVAPNREFVVEFRDVPHFGGGDPPVTFQLVLREQDSSAQVHCERCEGTDRTHTQGIEGADGLSALSLPGRNGAFFDVVEGGARYRATQGESDGFGDACDVCPSVSDPEQRDEDGDRAGDACDNCAGFPNPDQADADADNLGDACDEDADGDGADNEADNCPVNPNPDQTDEDGDAVGDRCDLCAFVADPEQGDRDGDRIGDACDGCPDNFERFPGDQDLDGVGDACDLCPFDADEDQEDLDADGVGDACDLCEQVPDPLQLDLDFDGLGDACDDDADGDGVDDDGDNCLGRENPAQEDEDGDGLGDACDNCLLLGNPAQDDQDRDGVGDVCDNCPAASNRDQLESDALALVAEPLPYAPRPSPSQALVLGDDQFSEPIAIGFPFSFYGRAYTEVWVSSNGFVTFDEGFSSLGNPSLGNPDEPSNLIAGYWADLHPGLGGRVAWEQRGSAPERELVVAWEEVPHYGQGAGSEVSFQIVLTEGGDAQVHCASCEPFERTHAQGIEGPGGLAGAWVGGRNGELFSAAQDGVRLRAELQNSDGLGDACDVCPRVLDPLQEDGDGDGAGDPCDTCPGLPNPAQGDVDGDGAGDECDPDADGDGLDNELDGCPLLPSQEQGDGDGDGVGDACDLCPAEPDPDQGDVDGDGAGDACDFDPDGDFLFGAEDLCPLTYDPGQGDSDGQQFSARAVPFAPRPSPEGVARFDFGGLVGPLPLGFEFVSFGRRLAQVWISPNGFVTFDGDGSSAPPFVVPEEFGPNDYVAGWATYYNPFAGGQVRYGLQGEAPAREFVVSYEGVVPDDGGEPATFQVVLQEGGAAEVHCDTCEPARFNSRVQGFEAPGGLVGYAPPNLAGRGASATQTATRFELGEALANPVGGDGVGDACDVCPFSYDPAQADSDGDGVGDACP